MDYTPKIDTIADIYRLRVANGHPATVTISSNSMAPLLRAGDRVKIERKKVERLRPGDIITLETDSGLLTHRLHRIENDSLLTKGDRSTTFDPQFHVTQMIGAVSEIDLASNQQSFHFSGRRIRLISQTLFNLARLEHFLTRRFFSGQQNRYLSRLIYGISILVSRPFMRDFLLSFRRHT